MSEHEHVQVAALVTVAEARALQGTLQQAIRDLIAAYELATGATVTSIDLQLGYEIDTGRRKVVDVNVDVAL